MPSTNRTRLVRVLYAFVLLAHAPSARAACAGFGAAGGIGAVASPQMAVSADFDGDGLADLAVACGTGATLAVLRGLGGGAFAAPVAYASGSAGRALAVGDFDGDASPDLAVCVSTGVAIWHGQAGGTFIGGVIVVMGSSPRGVVCADFDEDGVHDLAIASANTNALLVARGGGANGVPDGTFGPATSFPVGTNPARLVAADFDGDGILDLACANNSSASVSVLRGLGTAARGNGAFAPAANVGVAGSPWGLAVVDADRDGDADLLAGNGAGTTIAWLRNTGGAFANAATFTTPLAPRDLAVGDFDGDGLADVAAACAGGNNVSVLRGNGAGGYASLGNFTTASGATGIVAGDWNGDGSPDLAVANTGANSLSRLPGACPAAAGSGVALLSPNGGDSWWPGVDQQVRWTASGGVAAVNVDISRDGGASWRPLARGATGASASVPATGLPAAALRVRVSDALVPARADASDAGFTVCGLFGPARVSAAGLAATQLASADLDGDTIDDLVAVGAGLARVLRGAGDGRFTPGAAASVSPAVLRARLADATSDGLADLVTLDAGGLAVYAGDGAGGFGAATLVAFAGGTDFVAGDFDEDGALDFAVLAAVAGGARLDVRRGDGGEWRVSASATLDGAPGRLVCADFDDDGVVDLALEAGATLQIWSGDGAAGRGNGTFALASTRTLAVEGGDLAVGDADGDGRLDVCVCVPATGDLWTFANATAAGDPLMLFDAPLASAAGGTPASPALADLDGDGLADLVVALTNAARVAVLPGVAGGFGPAQTFGGGAGMLVADFTGDGSADVVVANGDSMLCLPSMCPPGQAASLALARLAEPTAPIGFERALAWTRTSPVASVRVELSRDGGARWTTLADAVAADRFAWTVTGPATDDARLRVSDASVSGRHDVTARFAIRPPYETAVASTSLADGACLAVGDLDGDALADAVVADGATLQVLRGGSPAGAFTEAARSASPGTRQVRIADLDRDGLADMVTLDAASVAVRRGLGAGAFGEPQASATGAGNAAFVVADFDEDGAPDVAIAATNGVAHRVSVLRGGGAGLAGGATFAPFANVGLPAAPGALVAGDWNADGVADLAVTHAAGLAVLLGNGAGGRGDGTFRLASTRAFGSGALRELAVCDVDGDGVNDLAAPDSAARALVLARGDGAGGFATPVSVAVPLAPRSLAAADADGDGHTDFVLAGSEAACLLRGTGAFAPGAFAPATLTPEPAVALALRDADGDGRADLLALAGGALKCGRGAIDPPAPAPRLLAPQGGEGPLPGDELIVQWTASGAPVDIELSRGGGARWERLATNLPGDVFRWTVTGPVTGDARLRVGESAVPTRADTSDASFTIGADALDAGITLPPRLALSAPRPNPSRGVVWLTLALPQAVGVTADVLDLAGRRVRILHHGTLAAGTHTLRWDGARDDGAPATTGVYFVRVRADGRKLTQTTRLLR